MQLLNKVSLLLAIKKYTNTLIIMGNQTIVWSPFLVIAKIL